MPPSTGSPTGARSDTHLIILVVVVVVVAVVAVSAASAAVLYFEVSQLGPGPATTPLGAAFAAGNPFSETCSPTMVSSDACVTSGDYAYSLTVEHSVVELDDVSFAVHEPTGALFANTNQAEFALVAASGATCAFTEIPAGAVLSMDGAWSNYANGCSPSAPLTTSMTIIVDMGQSGSTAGMGLLLEAVGLGGYSGTTVTGLP
jgi:hypothetical protein